MLILYHNIPAIYLRRPVLAHSALRSDPADYQRLLVDAEIQLSQVLRDLDFLGDLQLVCITRLQRHDQCYQHEARLYRGDNPNFPYIDIQLANALDSGHMYVITSTTQLSLHPLLIAERCPECGQEEVFLYQDSTDITNVTYHSSTTGHLMATTKTRNDLRTLLGMTYR